MIDGEVGWVRLHRWAKEPLLLPGRAQGKHGIRRSAVRSAARALSQIRMAVSHLHEAVSG